MSPSKYRGGKRSGVAVAICAATLGLTATALFYGSVLGNLNSAGDALATESMAEAEAPPIPAAEISASPKRSQQAAVTVSPATVESSVRAAEPSAPGVREAPTEIPLPIADITATPKKAAEQPWYLTLVNASHPLPPDHTPAAADVEDGYQFDARAVDPLLAMLYQAREEGLDPVICSAYRSVEKQQELYDEKTAQLIELGYTKAEAEKKARTIVAYPGTSEHNLGLAVDIVSRANGKLDKTQADTAEAKWLAAHCWEYGFILRYPEDKSDITGIIYEPWHFRYVGKDAAKNIMERGVCLEEYLGNV